MRFYILIFILPPNSRVIYSQQKCINNNLSIQKQDLMLAYTPAFFTLGTWPISLKIYSALGQVN